MKYGLILLIFTLGAIETTKAFDQSVYVQGILVCTQPAKFVTGPTTTTPIKTTPKPTTTSTSTTSTSTTSRTTTLPSTTYKTLKSPPMLLNSDVTPPTVRTPIPARRMRHRRSVEECTCSPTESTKPVVPTPKIGGRHRRSVEECTCSPTESTKPVVPTPKIDGRHRRSVADGTYNFANAKVELYERNKIWSDTNVNSTTVNEVGRFDVDGTEDENSQAEFYLYIQHDCTTDKKTRCFEHKVPSSFINKGGEHKFYQVYGIELLNIGKSC